MKENFWGITWVLLRRELLHEFRSRQRLLLMFLFATMSTLVFSYALELDRVARREAIAGVLWTTILFASLLGFERASAEERNSGMQRALRIAPIPRSAIFSSRLLANWFFTMAIALLTMLTQSWLFNLPLINGTALLALLLGALGIANIGTLLTGMLAQARAMVAILGVLMLPLAFPLLITAVRLTASTLWVGVSQGESLILLGLQDFILITLVYWLYPYVLDGQMG